MIKREIMVCGKPVKFRSSATVPRLYRAKFKRDIFRDLSKLEKSFKANAETGDEFAIDDLAVRQDSENPVYYVQYAHARICTMLSALAADGHEVPDINSADLSLLSTEQERELIKQVALLPEEIRLAARDYDPSRINKYVTELAARFHRFYTACRIKGAEEGVLNARLCLADTVRRVIALSLSVIGVSAPEKM